MNYPLISIVIPNWFEENMPGRHHSTNEVFYIANICLKRLKETLSNRNDVEIILVDNNSTLNGIDDFWSMGDVVVKEPRQGFAIAMNSGINVAKGEYIIAMNNDILLYGNDWLDKMMLGFKEKLDYPLGLLMPNLIKKEFQKDCVVNGKINFEKLVELKLENIVLRNENIYELHAEFGSMFMFTKELKDKIIKLNGGYQFYDERFLVGYSEDRWLYEQVRMLGYETYRSNKLRVAHVGGISMSKMKSREGVREKIDRNRELLKKLKELK